MWGITGLQPWQVGRLKKKSSLFSSIPYFPLMCCGVSYCWTLLNAALVWPDSSLLLHFPSNLPAQPSDCHRNAVKSFYSFCMAALFPQHCQYLCISSNTPFFLSSTASVCSLTGYFQSRMSNLDFLGSCCNKVLSLLVADEWQNNPPRVHQHLLNYFLLTDDLISFLWMSGQSLLTCWSNVIIFLFKFTSQL